MNDAKDKYEQARTSKSRWTAQIDAVIARREQMLATFVFSLASKRMDLSMHCRAGNFTKALEV